jgi:glycosyltransferase involved in cell wall biosynthesis
MASIVNSRAAAIMERMSKSRAAAVQRPTRVEDRGSRLRVLQMIAFLSDDGGAERFTLGLATHLSPQRFETWVCAPRGGEDIPLLELERAGVRFVDLGRRGRLDAYRLWKLAPLLRRQRIDVIHSHLFGSNLWASLLGKLCRVPVLIAHEHTWSYEGHRIRAWLDGHLIGRLTTRFVAVSASDAKNMVEIEGVPPAKVVVIPTAPVPRTNNADVNLRAELGLASDSLLIGTAVVMRPQKAIEVMLAAHAQVLADNPDVHLVLAGHGPCFDELKDCAARLGIETHTHFLGQRSDVDAVLRDLDIAVLSSDFEGLPLLVFECMAARTPLVATAVGGIPDVVEDGVTGVLVEPRQPAALAGAISKLLADPRWRRRLADAAADRVELYTIERVSARFGDLYESLALPRARDRRD